MPTQQLNYRTFFCSPYRLGIILLFILLAYTVYPQWISICHLFSTRHSHFYTVQSQHKFPYILNATNMMKKSNFKNSFTDYNDPEVFERITYWYNPNEIQFKTFCQPSKMNEAQTWLWRITQKHLQMHTFSNVCQNTLLKIWEHILNIAWLSFDWTTVTNLLFVVRLGILYSLVHIKWPSVSVAELEYIVTRQAL